jgi:hypothetical protein
MEITTAELKRSARPTFGLVGWRSPCRNCGQIVHCQTEGTPARPARGYHVWSGTVACAPEQGPDGGWVEPEPVCDQCEGSGVWNLYPCGSCQGRGTTLAECRAERVRRSLADDGGVHMDLCTRPVGHLGEHQDRTLQHVTGEIWCWA